MLCWWQLSYHSDCNYNVESEGKSHQSSESRIITPAYFKLSQGDVQDEDEQEPELPCESSRTSSSSSSSSSSEQWSYEHHLSWWDLHQAQHQQRQHDRGHLLHHLQHRGPPDQHPETAHQAVGAEDTVSAGSGWSKDSIQWWPGTDMWYWYLQLMITLIIWCRINQTIFVNCLQIQDCMIGSILLSLNPAPHLSTLVLWSVVRNYCVPLNLSHTSHLNVWNEI